MLAALAMLASVLVAAPAVAADDPPEPTFTATFDACGSAPSSGFTDVPASHGNAGDIDCIAYYGVTKGTSATTYSPLMAVSREHMALFLTRLASLVGIEMVSNPDDAGFTDIGDLSDNSQNAINQLADLGIAKGTSDTTFSPGDSVRRDHMALFISRLMDEMNPMEVNDSTYGYKPENVGAVEDDEDTTGVDETIKADEIDSPYGDLGSTTKTAFDAITVLYELGVVSGISDTSYGPGRLITRAAMAEFMAAVLDHSNARPAGISMQAVDTEDIGPVSTTIVVSYRTDSFAPMADVSLYYFNTADTEALTEDNTCGTADECNTNSDLTDDGGNFAIDGNATNGDENSYYVWMADEDNDDFDADDVAYATITLASSPAATSFTVKSDIAKNANGADDNDAETPEVPNRVDVDVTNSVTFTVQLVDAKEDAVAKSDVEFTITYRRETDTDDQGVDDDAAQDDTLTSKTTTKIKTDDNGQVTFTVSAPATDDDPKVNDKTILDSLTFAAFVVPAVGDAEPVAEEAPRSISWRDDAPGTPNKAILEVPDYALTYQDGTTAVLDGKATVTLYDMYGNTAGRGLRVSVTFEGRTDEDNELIPVVDQVNSRGEATFSATKLLVPDANMLDVTISLITKRVGTINEPQADTVIARSAVDMIAVVTSATDDTAVAAVEVQDVFGDDNQFYGTYTPTAGMLQHRLFSYDADDTFIDLSGKIITMDKFESSIDADDMDVVIAVLVYNADGASIFKISSSTASDN